MAKFVEHGASNAAEWLHVSNLQDIYSVSGCVSGDFADYVDHWKHNGYWFFDSPSVIREIAKLESVNLERTKLFYYEAHPLEFDGREWLEWQPDPSFATNVLSPKTKQLAGFDVVSFSNRNSPEHSPLSCNSLAGELSVNLHCLFNTFEQAESCLNGGAFKDSEPGPYRIFAVYTVPWSSADELV